MAILELEDGRKKALAGAGLVQGDREAARRTTSRSTRPRPPSGSSRAMVAVQGRRRRGRARLALREKKAAEVEAAKIERDKHEAASYAIQLNKSRKEFETKLQMLKLRKGTLATQIAAARSAGGDAFGNDTSVWDASRRAEDRIDQEAIETEVDAAMRGEEAPRPRRSTPSSRRSTESAGLLAAADGPDDALAKLKDEDGRGRRRRSRRRSRPAKREGRRARRSPATRRRSPSRLEDGSERRCRDVGRTHGARPIPTRRCRRGCATSRSSISTR